MMTFSDLASVPRDPLAPFTDRLRLAVAAYLARFKGSPARTPNLTSAAIWHGAPSVAWTRWPRSVRTWSCTSGGCRKSAGSNPPPSPGGSPSRPGFYSTPMDRHAATRRLHHLAETVGIQIARAHRTAGCRGLVGVRQRRPIEEPDGPPGGQLSAATFPGTVASTPWTRSGSRIAVNIAARFGATCQRLAP
jgi:hypothetical protein